LPSRVLRAFTLLFSFLVGLLHSVLLFLPDPSDPHRMCSFFSSLGPRAGADIRMADCPFARVGKRHNSFAAGFGNSDGDRFQSLSAFGADTPRTLAHRSEPALR